MKIPIRTGTKNLLEDRMYDNDARRPYLGMSGVGEPCSRRLYYGFHWTSPRRKLTARTKRIFRIGNLFERMMIDELKDNGMEVYRITPEGERVDLTGDTEELQETLVGFGGHEIGHCDGRIKGVQEAPKTEHLLELKTMAEKYFKSVKEKGVSVSHPEYYAQCQKYMHKMKLTRAFFIAINKNTCELYIERIEYDKGIATELDRKAQDIIMATEPPPKHYLKGHFKCNFCEHNAVCHEEAEPLKNCRTCEFSDLEEGGKWSCSNRRAVDMLTKGKCEDEMEISLVRQEKGCKHYKRGWI